MRLFSTATIKQAKKKIETTPWAKAGWRAVQRRISEWQRSSGLVPVEAGGWIHNYVCSEHWLPLSYDGDAPDAHACPAGHTCTGEKYDAAWRVWRHRQIADLARDAGLAYVVLGSEDGRKTAVSILTQYADFYTKFDGLSDAEPWMLKGHAFNQALTEGLWAIPLIHAYDLVADSLDDAQRERIEQDLWGPLTAVMIQAQDKLIAQDKVKHNYMSWVNVTLGCLGFALADQSLINRAIQPPAGFNIHLDLSTLADGLEFEGTPYYHNFVLLAHLLLAEAAKANGIDLYAVTGTKGQTLVGMGSAFASLAWPDGTIPDLAEGSYWQDSIYDPEIYQSFEMLYAAQAEPVFAQTLRTAYKRQGVARDNWAALLYGRDDIATVGKTGVGKTAVSTPATHTFLEQSGIAVLRSQKQLAAMIPFGPYRKHHHQADRLSLTVWPFSQDAGSPLYGLASRKAWYPHSYAHNTLVVDGQSHEKCGGELLDWTGHSLYATAPDAYPGVHFDRTTKMVDDIILDELAVQSDEEHTFDWVFHIDGEVALSDGLTPLSQLLAEEGAASYIKLHAQMQVDTTVSVVIEFNSMTYQLTLGAERPFTLLIGNAPGTSRHPQQQRLVLIGRTIGIHQRYQTTIKQL